ncbi:MAG: ATP-binding protein [Nostoc sp. ChiSLP02]|nr:ATP-binding protein [Nostoc sp. DedSLP05]MDZ8101750.1 ATP-binding protein [Nostoc sp. DedSLP01]MDZ8184976.1 ATP-binding protein [Nostoc sp. ChiSLP02]
MINSNISENIFVGDSEMAGLMRSLDWSQTPLGAVSGWAQSLKTSISILMSSRYPMFVWWGREYANLYNDAYRPILGASKHPQFLGKSAKDCWADVWDVVGPLADSVLDTGQSTWSENLLLIMDRYGYAEEAYFTFSYSPVRDESGGVGGIFCAVIETTKQVIGERRLRTLRELSASTVEAKAVEEACHFAMAALSANAEDIPFALLYLIEANGSEARLVSTTTSIEPGTIASPQQMDLTDTRDLWNLSRVNQTKETELVEDLTVRFGTLPGGAWPEPSNTALVIPLTKSGQTQQLAGLLVVGISPRRALDDEYQGFFDLIGTHVTTAIANAEAYAAERRRAEALAELDQAKTLFFSNISHEFRTPLTLMLNPLEDILANPSGPIPSDREQLEIVYRNSKRLLKLVNSLLDFSRIEAGRVEAVYEPTDLAMFTADLAGIFRSAIERAGLSLQVDCPSLPELVYVDRQMWEKIVLNLLSNAFKFTFEGEITVSLSWQDCQIARGTANEITPDRSPASSPQVILQVRDTGTGIPSEDLPLIFNRFHRVKGAKGRSYEGSGIGLSLVQELVRLHEGTIEVSSVIDRGTCFTVSIPAGYDHLPSDRIQGTRTLTSTAMGATYYVEEVLQWLPNSLGTDVYSLGQAEEQGSRGAEEKSSFVASSARILLADDNADMRAYVKRLLSQQYEVETVTDGVAALAAIRRQLPDLVLTDVMMPELDGFGLLQELRANPQTKDLPIILLSARAGEESRIEGLAAGADDYLTKPFSARELLARVEATLKLAQVRREATQQEQRLRLEAETAREAIENILSSISDGFFTLDRDWRYTYANDRLCEMAGKQREELLGYNIWELFPDAVGTDVYVQFHRAMHEQTSLQFEYLYWPWNRWFEYRVYPSPNGLTIFVVEVTDRKRADAEREQLLQTLLDERARFEAVLRQMPEGVIIADAASKKLILANERTNQILQHSFDLHIELQEYEELVPFHAYRPDGQIYAPDDYPLMRSLLTGEVVSHEEIEIRYRDGSQIVIDASSSPICDRQGQITSAVVLMHDITDAYRQATQRKQAEIALRQSEDKFRRLANAMPQIVWTANANGEVDYVSQQWFDYAGLTLEQTQDPLQYVQVIHPDDVSQLYERWSEAITSGSLYQTEVRIQRASDGNYRWFLTRAVPIKTEEGEIVAWYGTSTDIDDRKQAEVEREQFLAREQSAKETLQKFIEHTPVAVVMLDREMRYLFASHQWMREYASGYTDLKGLSHYEVLTDTPERWRQAHQRCLAGATERCEEDYYPRYDGSVQWLYWEILPWYASCGEIGGIIIFAENITERKQAAQERQKLLEREQAAREAAEAANRIKDEFLAVLSHELRSPLNPILGWSKLLQSGKLDAVKTKQALATIERNAKLQSELIEDLLDVSRILRGKLSLTVSTINLVSTVQAALETVRLAAEAKSIEIKAKLNPELGLVLGDSTRLQQVVWNLLSNAVKFTPDGGRVEVQLEQIDSLAQITVTDTGIGITPDFLPFVFEYFRQADGTTTRKFGGLGLGLAIVRHLVELHGGTVKADSPGVGLGATFTVRLPLIPNQPRVDGNFQLSQASVDLNGIQVLVVDDDTDTREFVTFVLEQARAKVIAVACASEAISALTQSHFDVLISDIGMPQMDGYMLMQHIEALPAEQRRQIKAIALTAYAGDFNQQKALQAGFQRHITKPIEPEHLLKEIVRVLSMQT